jgi:methyltransferase (TIGR00027 family)
MMKNKQRDSTARATAAIRAMHVLYDQQVVFDDPYALQFTRPAFRRVCRSRFFPWLLRRRFVSDMLQPISAQVLSRAKYCEEKLEQAVSKGIAQYVIIGAGFDSFCLRRPDFASCLRIYEIDHPTTQQMKQQRLMEIVESSLRDVEFLAVDLEKQTIFDALSGSSFSKDEKAFFSWLGTVPYLSEDAVFNVLRHLASFAANGSEIVFDYLIPTQLMTQEERRVLGRAMRMIARFGEPVKSFFKPDIFPSKISQLGYDIFENQSPAEQNKQYFFDRSDHLKTHSAAYNIHMAIDKD